VTNAAKTGVHVIGGMNIKRDFRFEYFWQYYVHLKIGSSRKIKFVMLLWISWRAQVIHCCVVQIIRMKIK